MHCLDCWLIYLWNLMDSIAFSVKLFIIHNYYFPLKNTSYKKSKFILNVLLISIRILHQVVAHVIFRFFGEKKLIKS